MRIFNLIVLVMASLMGTAQDIRGAWKMQADNGTAVLIINDNYAVISMYNKENKTFDYTEGGLFQPEQGKMLYTSEFNSKSPEKVGEKILWQVTQKGDELTLQGEPGTLVFTRIDKAADHPMAGTWHITERAGDTGSLVKIHQSGTRKTLKILSATRFQWIAIDPAVKGFYGTGGGTYTARDGKYVEHIEFFSRDNSRVGAELAFNWKLDNGRWDHSGKSSKGDPIHEIWEKVAWK